MMMALVMVMMIVGPGGAEGEPRHGRRLSARNFAVSVCRDETSWRKEHWREQHGVV